MRPRSLSFPIARSPMALAACLAALAAPAFADDDPAVTPYRPSVSSPAALSAPGWLEMEVGGLAARGPFAERRYSLPTTFKLAFTPDLGVVLGGEAFVQDGSAGGAPVRGVGDTSLTLKQRFAVDERRAFGLELGTTFPTATHGLGNGAQAWTANGIYSADFATDWHTDLNLNETRVDAQAGLPATWQAGWAAALSRSINDDWGAVAELSGTHVPRTTATNQLLVAASYNASKAAVLDVGVAQGLNRVTPHLQVFVGGTFRLGRLF